jgi:putative transcriptional regulator
MAMDTCLKHQFLLAMPGLLGDFFGNTITYICEHNEDGAMGLMINRPMEISVANLLEHLGIDTESGLDEPVLMGGPVQTERGLILHTDDSYDAASHSLGNGLMLSSTLESLRNIGSGCGPDQFLLALGHAGWGPGQLEGELAENAWLTCPASAEVLFDTPIEDRIDKAASTLGIDFRLMGHHAGHA